MEQRLVQSPQMIQAMQILQLSALDLQERIDAELAEGRYALEPSHDLTPERIYEKRWALTLIERALDRLRERHARAGKEHQFEVLSTNGDTFLGGEDFDQRVIDWLVEGFQHEHGIDLRQDRMALQRLKDAAEKAKCELSAVTETEVNLPFIISSARNEALHLQRLLTRSTLEELTADLVDRTVQICELTLGEAGLDKDEIEDIILVGGMTRMPKVQEVVQNFFGKEPRRDVNPDEAVALDRKSVV